MDRNQGRYFRFGIAIQDIYQDLADILPDLEDRLNERLHLPEYTPEIEKIYFIPVVLVDDSDWDESIHYDQAEHKVFIQLKIRPRELQGEDVEHFKNMLGKRFLNGLRQLTVVPEQLAQDIEILWADEILELDA